MAKKNREKVETKNRPFQKPIFKSKQESNPPKKQEPTRDKFRYRTTPETSNEDSFFLNASSTVEKVKGADDGEHSQASSVRQDKKFDKKLWRLKKYSNKYKLQQWEEIRKKTVLRDYQKTLKREDSKFDVQKIYQEYDEQNNGGSGESSKPESKKRFKNAKQHFEDIRAVKQAQKEQWLKKKAAKEEAFREYKKKKLEKFKKLSRRTKKGQPIMKDRIEMLLEKIQSSITT